MIFSWLLSEYYTYTYWRNFQSLCAKPKFHTSECYSLLSIYLFIQYYFFFPRCITSWATPYILWLHVCVPAAREYMESCGVEGDSASTSTLDIVRPVTMSPWLGSRLLCRFRVPARWFLSLNRGPPPSPTLHNPLFLCDLHSGRLRSETFKNETELWGWNDVQRLNEYALKIVFYNIPFCQGYCDIICEM